MYQNIMNDWDTMNIFLLILNREEKRRQFMNISFLPLPSTDFSTKKKIQNCYNNTKSCLNIIRIVYLY